ncbi:MAG: protein-glutamine gamma-glutamyltransferase [Verrucomicrobiota bacterium]|jgi:transglutaminase-like putative cysteine protease
MTTPPFLLGVTLLFWGWQTGLLWVGVLAALAVEGSRIVRVRWNFPQADLDRIYNLCTALFFGSWVIAFATGEGSGAISGLMKNTTFAARAENLNKGVRAVLHVFQWLPISFLPLMLAQAFGQSERMEWQTFSWWARRQRKRGEPAARGSGLNVTWPYFALCLIAACSANESSRWFSAGLAALAAWALWTRRSRSFSNARWAACLGAALLLGVAVQQGLRGLQHIVQRLDNAFVAGLTAGRQFDPKESRTMIGSIGRVKQSGSILLRLETDGQSPPGLLREASYNVFKSPVWGSTKRNFSPTIPESDTTTWWLLPGKETKKSVTISEYLSGGKGLLALPRGTARLEELGVYNLETNRFGAARSVEGPGFVRFRAAYGEGSSIDVAPETDDLEVPEGERPALGRIADELSLEGRTAAEKLHAVRRLFIDHFHYSTWLGPEHSTGTAETPLSAFLLKHRRGHCEYFATATVLLLRRAGIPARYAAGYSVQEKKGNQWVVRGRHAHAWCLAWIDNAWQDIDNTPSDWNAVEEARAPWWEGISDKWSRLRYEFSKWRWGGGEWKRYLLWLVVPLILLLAARLFFQKQWTRILSRPAKNVSPTAWPGLDSEFYGIARALADRGVERRPGETLSAWLARVAVDSRDAVRGLEPLLQLHYRLRFDPHGLNPEERTGLREGSGNWTKSNGVGRP